MLAGIIEQVNCQNKQIDHLGKDIERMSNELNKIVNFEGSQYVQPEVQSVITLKDHEEKMASIKRDIHTLFNQYMSLLKKNKELQEAKRYWATQQWAKHFFRWLFVKRHFWIWLIYGLYSAFFILTLYAYSQQRVEIENYKETEIKYRYLKAVGVAHNTIQSLDDIFDYGNSRKIQVVYSTVYDYDKALKHKSDSIVKAESKKMEKIW